MFFSILVQFMYFLSGYLDHRLCLWPLCLLVDNFVGLPQYRQKVIWQHEPYLREVTLWDKKLYLFFEILRSHA